MTDSEPTPGSLDSEGSIRALIGPTAVGKSALALELAERAGAEIVSMDSMLVYRGMDVGTAKPDAAERARVPHYCIDLVEPSEPYDARRYLADANAALADVVARGRRALFVGGTGFYLQALVHGLFGGPPTDPDVRRRLQERSSAEGRAALHAELAAKDPASAERIHPNDEKRVQRALEVLEQTGRPLSSWQREWGWNGEPSRGRPRRVVGLTLDADALEERIRSRTRAMLAGGWPEEARRIRDGGGFGPTAIQALGYREVLDLVDGRVTRARAEEDVALRTRQFARRQRTWFRRFRETVWIDARASDRVERALAALGWGEGS